MQRVTTSSYPSDSLPNRWHIAMRLTGKTLGYTLLVGIGLALLVTACLKCHLLEEVNRPFGTLILVAAASLLTVWLSRSDRRLFNSRPSDWMLWFTLLPCAVIFSNIAIGINYRMSTTISLPTITQQNLPQVLEANYIRVESLQTDSTRYGGVRDIYYTESQHSTQQHEVIFLACPIRQVRNTYLGKKARNEEEMELGGEYGTLFLKRVLPSGDMPQYRVAVMYSRYHYYAGAEEPIVLEVSSEEEAETGIHSPRYILLALLGETLLLLFSGLLFKPQPRPEKKEKGWHVNRTRLLVWIRMGMQPKMIVLWIYPALWLLYFLLLVLHGFNPFSSNMELLFRYGAAFPELVTYDGEYWRLLTCTFLHGGILHLGGNLVGYGIALFFLLFMEQDRYSNRQISVTFLICALMSSVCVIVQGENGVIGASGGIFGLYGMYIGHGIYRRLQRIVGSSDDKEKQNNKGKSIGLLYPMALIIGLNLLYSLEPGVSLLGHVSGLIVGLIMGMALLFFDQEE